MTDEMVTWLRARLDDEACVARAATPGPWAVDSLIHAETITNADGVTVVGGGRWGDEASVFETTEDAVHIARQDPAATLTRVRAHQQILDECVDELENSSFVAPGKELAEKTLRLLASAYRGQPGWREEWTL
ncbi:MAG: DUF6221 family protein [Mycobacteriales bacterium]